MSNKKYSFIDMGALNPGDYFRFSGKRKLYQYNRFYNGRHYYYDKYTEYSTQDSPIVEYVKRSRYSF